MTESSTHRLLSRQLRRALGVGDDVALAEVVSELSRLGDASALSPDAQRFLQGIPDFLGQVSDAYRQSERDLELAKRSLEMSSGELTQANAKLRSDAETQARILASLRETTNRLLAPLNRRIDEAEGFAVLTDHLNGLIVDLLRARQELETRQFALDQHAIVSMTDLAGNIVYANDRFCEISGYTREELLGKNHRIVNSGYHPKEVFRDMWDTIASGKVWHGEVCNRSRNGSTYWVAATVVPLLEDGLPVQYISIRTDITGQKELENRIEREQRFLQSVMDTLGEGVYTLDVNENCSYMNREAQAMLGWKQEEVLGRNLHDLVHFQTLDHQPISRDNCPTHRCIQDGRVYRSEDDAFTRKDGSVFPISVIAAPLLEGGRVVGSVAAFQDITARKLSEAEMRRARDEAEAASRAKGEFLATMSHEIRTPMNGIIGMTELALDTELSEPQREYLDLVKSSADSLLTIINDVLDFSKIEAGHLELEHVPFRLRDLIGSALRPLSMRAYTKGLEISYEVAGEVPETVVGDPGRLRQILVNLVGNSIKFSPKGEIAVRVSGTTGTPGATLLEFSVSDTGIGIPAEKQAHIFEAFAQADNSTTRRYGGTGLGLTICHRLVTAMGGQIGVESEVGKGSRFHFTARFDLAANQGPRSPDAVDLTGVSVLIMDDHETNLRLLFQLLSKWGMTVSAVTTGSEALDAIASAAEMNAPFRIALLDVMMPDMDGFEVAEKIGNELRQHDTAIAILTSGGFRGDGERCRNMGVSAYLSKPIVPEELKATLQSMLSPQRLPLITRHSLAEERQRNGRRILLAEDNPVNQKLALTLLSKWGHHVTLAQNGHEAVARSAEEKFDLILMDMQMPDMGGVEATTVIRERENRLGEHVRIVAMTANAMERDRDACIAAGMDDYLSKPLDSQRLKAIVDDLAGPVTDASEPGIAVGSVSGFDYTAALAKSDPWIIGVVAEPFRDDWPKQLAYLENALTANDLASVQRIGHTIKGLAANFDAQPAMELGRSFEKFDGTEDGRVVNRMLGDLRAELQGLDVALVQFVRDNPDAAA